LGTQTFSATGHADAIARDLSVRPIYYATSVQRRWISDTEIWISDSGKEEVARDNGGAAGDAQCHNQVRVAIRSFSYRRVGGGGELPRPHR
jgi:hypothetical protein